ncbi:MAG: hypothetical protein CENE_03328 [Candidatus Celerinatantimonas neptuna]|nr:MAG: hypothetical protein CENE_03328 [Candidatus Celerinatantimonas neptuna]
MIRVQPRLESSRWMTWFSPILAIILTMLLSSLLFMALHVSPLKAFDVFIIQPLSSTYNLGELAVKAAPLLLCAIGLALCYRANIWNIGAEGQFSVGALAGSWVALQATDNSGPQWLIFTLLVGTIAGMLWAGIPTLLYRLFRTNIILTTIMMNYIGLYLLLWAVHGPLIDPSGYGFPQSAMFAQSVMLPTLTSSGRATVSIVIAIAVAIVAGLVLYRTMPGFRMRVFGSDESAAHYAGFRSGKVIWNVMLTAGALAGFAGVAEVTGPIGQLVPQVSPGYGYAAIIVAYLGRLNPFGVIFAAFFMGILYLGSDLAQISLGLPTAITGLFQGMLLFMLLGSDFLIHYRVIWVSRRVPSNVK